MKRKFRLVHTGAAAACVYLMFTLISYLNYPSAFTPFNNWLSDLGNPVVNEAGALFYNIGCASGGALLVFFCIGALSWDAPRPKSWIPLRIAKIAGILTALFLIVSAFYPIGSETAVHTFCTFGLYFCIALFESFSAVGILLYPGAKRWQAVFGYSASLANLAAICILGVFVGEWITVFLLMSYVVILSFFPPIPGEG